MKTFTLCALFLFYCLPTFAQKFSVGLDKMNVVYIGISNPLTVTVENLSSKEIVLKTDNGTITGMNGQYEFMPGKGTAATISIYKKRNGKLIKVGQAAYRVKNIPYPVFKIGSGKDKVSKPEIANQQYVRAELEGIDMDANFTIDSFDVCIVASDTCKFLVRKNVGNKLSDEIRNDFNLLKPNDIVIFKNIYFRRLDGVSDQLVPVMISILH